MHNRGFLVHHFLRWTGADRWITVLIGNQDIYFRANRDWLYFSESFEFNADVSQQHLLTNLVAEWRGVVPRFPTEPFGAEGLPLGSCLRGHNHL